LEARRTAVCRTVRACYNARGSAAGAGRALKRCKPCLKSMAHVAGNS
jgi:hypothetical protein